MTEGFNIDTIALLTDGGRLVTDAPPLPECWHEGCSRPPYKEGRCKSHFDLWCYRTGRIGRPPLRRVVGKDVREACAIPAPTPTENRYA